MRSLARAGKPQLIIGFLAIMAIVLGLVVAGDAVPSNPPPPAASTATSPATTGDNSGDQAFLLRDYPQLAAGDNPDSALDWSGIILGLGLKLLFVVALAYAAIWALKRYMSQREGSVSSKKIVSLLGSLDLSPNRTVYVVEVGRKVIVLGASQAQISLLTEITDPEALNDLKAEASRSPEAVPFPVLLDRVKDQFFPSSTSAPREWADGGLAQKLAQSASFLEGKADAVRKSVGLN